MTTTVTRRTAQLALAVDCGTCPAVADQPCTDPDGAQRPPHPERVTALHDAADALHALPVGYTCKRCNGPAPLGVGYTSTALGAYWNSVGRTACDCGWSVVAS